MESANLHHQLHEHQLALSFSSSSSSLSSSSSSYGAAASSHACTQSITLNTDNNNFHPNCNGVVLNPRQKNESLAPTLNISTTTSMIQDSGFHHWSLTNNAGSSIDHDFQLSKIKQQISNSFPRFTNMSHNTTSPSGIDDHQKNLNDLREKLLLKTISSGFPINAEMYSSPHRSYVSSLGSLSNCMPTRGHFSQIYPSINISNLNQSSSPSSSSSNSIKHMNLQALDLLTSSSSRPHDDPNLSLFRDTALFNLDRLNPTTLKPSSCRPSELTSYANQITEPKRSNGLVEPQPAPPTPAPKKPRVESRVTSPPFKVRKEKLGDRIAALQQLVAPFGKTDTASVLMEAIGYIKFLQNQVETLSVPYMKSSGRKSSRTMQGVPFEDDGEEEAIRDLRSRGLCLVPLSCMSYVTADSSGGGIWPPPNFGGGT